MAEKNPSYLSTKGCVLRISRSILTHLGLGKAEAKAALSLEAEAHWPSLSRCHQCDSACKHPSPWPHQFKFPTPKSRNLIGFFCVRYLTLP